ncbi:hypothetical protein [Duganella radicis]|uniref:Uncharacterized protein n=1 Tax=Duganella radicis TaxID=551988 RepID=A0A6L6PEG1_9BURK|nr:hypothetical protein [Duganella radicis]MTV36971.1 hypothetical protein [Duganella radicis]
MLYEFISQNHAWLLDRGAQLRKDRGQVPIDHELDKGFALFLDQLIASLQQEESEGAYSSGAISGPVSGAPSQSEVGMAAFSLGSEVYALGLPIDQLVHSYGDMCQAIVELAEIKDLRLEIGEYRLLNHCLDNAIASAVSEYEFHHHRMQAAQSRQGEMQSRAATGERIRKHLGTATTAIAALKLRELTLGGMTGKILERSLLHLNEIVSEMGEENNANQVADTALHLVPLTTFLTGIVAAVAPCASVLKRSVTLAPVNPALALQGPLDLLAAALIGLLQACLERTIEDDEIALHGYARGSSILIDIIFPVHGAKLQEGDASLLLARRLLLEHQATLTVRDSVHAPYTLAIALPRHQTPT